MKIEVTEHAIREAADHVLAVPYCGLQNLLLRFQPHYYLADDYGWSADVYTWDNVAIVTGYRPIGDPVPRDIIQRYNAVQIGMDDRPLCKTMQAFIDEALRAIHDEVPLF